MSTKLVPLALSSEIDNVGMERIHAAPYYSFSRPVYVAPDLTPVHWNPEDTYLGVLLFADSNLTVTNANQGTGDSVRAVSYKSSGKYYYECKINAFSAAGGNESPRIGINKAAPAELDTIGDWVNSWGLMRNGTKAHNFVFTSITSSLLVNDIVMVAVDLDSGKIWFGVNGTWLGGGNPSSGTGEAYSGISGNITPACHIVRAIGQPSDSITARFNSTDWDYAAPSGFSMWYI